MPLGRFERLCRARQRKAQAVKKVSRPSLHGRVGFEPNHVFYFAARYTKKHTLKYIHLRSSPDCFFQHARVYDLHPRASAARLPQAFSKPTETRIIRQNKFRYHRPEGLRHTTAEQQQKLNEPSNLQEIWNVQISGKFSGVAQRGGSLLAVVLHHQLPDNERVPWATKGLPQSHCRV